MVNAKQFHAGNKIVAYLMIFLAPLLISTSVLLSNPQQARALTDQQESECMAKLNGQVVMNTQVTSEGTLHGLYVNLCSEQVSGICNIEMQKDNFGAERPYYVCSTSADRKVQAQKQSLISTYSEALVDKFCAANNQVSNQYCSQAIQQATRECLTDFFNNGYQNSGLTFPAINNTTVGNCIATSAKLDAKDVILTLGGAADKANTGAQETSTKVDKLRQKSDCVTSGGTWDEAKDPPCTEKLADTTSTCSPDIGAVGWMVCPIMTFIGAIADGAYAGIRVFVETKPQLLTDKNTVAAWEMFRNIANIMFVIVFLIIVFSQVTSVGITNYGIKKMLPRMIIGAILVNMSLIICQLAVDLSNILGGSIIALFNSAGASIGLETNTPQNGFLVFIGWVLAGTGLAIGIVVLALAVTVPVIIAATLSLLMTFVILILRNAAILMLTVIAPLAFVAYLLPNTESLFKKWYKMFYTLLLVFPIISLLYGAGKLASLILGTSQDWGMQLAALGTSAIPLILLPPVVNGAMKSTGALGAKLSGFSDKANNNIGKKVEDTKIGQINKHRKQSALARRAKIQGGTYTGMNPLSRLTSGVNRRINNSKLSGRWGNRQAAEGASVVASQDAEDMKHAVARLDSLVDGDVPLTSDELVEIAMGKDVTTSSGQVIKASSLDSHTRRAAMEKVAPIATVDQAHKLVAAATAKDATGKNIMGASERKTLSQALSKSSIPTKAPYIGGKTLGDIEAGNVDLTSAALASIKAGKITPEALASMDANALRHLVASARTTASGSTERLALMEAYNQIYAPGSQLASRVTTGTDHESALSDIITL